MYHSLVFVQLIPARQQVDRLPSAGGSVATAEKPSAPVQTVRDAGLSHAS